MPQAAEQARALDPGSSPPQVTVLTEYRVKGMRGPSRIAVTSDGLIVVTDTPARKVFVLSPTGQLLDTIDTLGAPLGLAVGAQDRIYVGDKRDGSVTIFDVNGTPIGQLGGGAGEFGLPNDLAYDPVSRAIFVVDSRADRIAVYDDVGAFMRIIGGSGEADGQLRFPTSVYLDPVAGHLYVADDGNHRIQVFDRDGGFVRTFGAYGNAEGQFTRPQGIAQDAAGRIYVVDTFQGDLQVVDREGGYIAVAGAFGKGPRQLYLPTDAAFSQGRLFVTSHGTAKIVVFGVDEYVDPTVVLRADVYLDPPVFNVFSRTDWIKAIIEVPEGTATQILPPSVALAGVAASNGVPFEFGDADGDGVDDLTVHFQRTALLRAVGAAGTYELDLLGEFGSGERIEGKVSVEILAEGGR